VPGETISPCSSSRAAQLLRVFPRRKRELLRRAGAKWDPRPGSEATSTSAAPAAGKNSEELAARLLEHGLIVSPGTFFGPSGEANWRLALVPDEAECERAARILERVLVSTLRVRFGWRAGVGIHLAVQRTAREVAR